MSKRRKRVELCTAWSNQPLALQRLRVVQHIVENGSSNQQLHSIISKIALDAGSQAITCALAKHTMVKEILALNSMDLPCLVECIETATKYTILPDDSDEEEEFVR